MNLIIENDKPTAAGILFKCRDEYLFLLRDDGLWGIPGGKSENNESEYQTALREFQEECGYTFNGPMLLKNLDSVGDFNYYTFQAPVAQKFTPNLNHEHSKFVWATQPPSPSHPGLNRVFKK